MMRGHSRRQTVCSFIAGHRRPITFHFREPMSLVVVVWSSKSIKILQETYFYISKNSDSVLQDLVDTVVSGLWSQCPNEPVGIYIILISLNVGSYLLLVEHVRLYYFHFSTQFTVNLDISLNVQAITKRDGIYSNESFPVW